MMNAGSKKKDAGFITQYTFRRDDRDLKDGFHFNGSGPLRNARLCQTGVETKLARFR